MNKTQLRDRLGELAIPLALLAVAAVATVATWGEQSLEGRQAARWLAGEIAGLPQAVDGRVLITVPDTQAARTLAETVTATVAAANGPPIVTVTGGPPTLRKALEAAAAGPDPVLAVVADRTSASWPALDKGLAAWPEASRPRLVVAPTFMGSMFLTRDNLRNIADQIAVIAIIAIGMTMVIISGGIDLSVGSVLALSGVVTALLVRDAFGGVAAGTVGMLVAGLAGVAVGGLAGCCSGFLVAVVKMPAFVATLGMMLVARGLAFLLTHGQSVSQLPETFTWLGRGRDLLGIPNAVVLAAVLYVSGSLVLRRMTFGRYLYAIGGAAEAARLAGVPSRRILVAAYSLCGALAGLGGVITASQLRSGAPATGEMKELYVIAAVVVGGTSLSGGEGALGGTLLGALFIAVIENAMNLTGIESFTQKVVLGLVILAAVGLDMARRRKL